MADAEDSFRVCGYPRLAYEMEKDSSIAMVRKFTALSNESLLYFQAELIALEKELRDLQKRDSRPGPGMTPDVDARCAKDWEWLGVFNPDCQQWKKVLRIREVLKDYNKAILRQVQMHALEAPLQYDKHEMQRRLKNSEAVTDDPLGLQGEDRLVWGSIYPGREAPMAKDLAALHPRPETDPFSTLIAEKCTPWLYRHLRKVNETILVSDRTQYRYTAMVTTVIASLLPIASIAILYSNKSIKARLALIGIFTFIFASSLVCFSTAKRTEVFSATAAFAAVQVVFIGTNGS